VYVRSADSVDFKISDAAKRFFKFEKGERKGQRKNERKKEIMEKGKKDRMHLKTT
jgi:hypothetical protein